MKPLILLTNDDGIESPGLAAAAAALDPLGELLIVAPKMQQTGMGRSRTQQYGNDGRLFKHQVTYNQKAWDGIAANATPALAVIHAVQELAQRPIDLVVSGINYGVNVGSSVTMSGTIGAALEAADSGIPAMAVSLEIFNSAYFEHDPTVDFSSAIHFLRLFASRMLAQEFPLDVDILKIEVPANATSDSKWMVTAQDKLMYYQMFVESRSDPFAGAGPMFSVANKGKYSRLGTDAFALSKGWVSVTPLSIDMTSRVDFAELTELLNS